jgi:hypothetical protein
MHDHPVNTTGPSSCSKGGGDSTGARLHRWVPPPPPTLDARPGGVPTATPRPSFHTQSDLSSAVLHHHPPPPHVPAASDGPMCGTSLPSTTHCAARSASPTTGTTWGGPLAPCKRWRTRPRTLAFLASACPPACGWRASGLLTWLRRCDLGAWGRGGGSPRLSVCSRLRSALHPPLACPIGKTAISCGRAGKQT